MNIEDERTFIEAARKRANQLRHGNATQIALAEMIDQMRTPTKRCSQRPRTSTGGRPAPSDVWAPMGNERAALDHPS
jgi:hypothetical protein